MEIVWSSSFQRAFKKLDKKHPQLQAKAIEVLKVLATDSFTPSLKSHIVDLINSETPRSIYNAPTTMSHCYMSVRSGANRPEH